MKDNPKFYLSFISGLVLVNFLVWNAVVTVFSYNKLSVVACDVGQGDGILIQKGAYTITIDAGPTKGDFVSCLSSHMPFWDKQIELAIITHPQLDHYGGMEQVLAKYKVKYLLANGLDSSSDSYTVLKNMVGGQGVVVLTPEDTPSVRVGLMSLDVVWPNSRFVNTHSQTLHGGDDQVLGSRISDEDPNNFSVLVQLTYGEFDALFTGDIGPEITDEILRTGEISPVEYLKVPHHGSENGLTEELLKAVSPSLAVISVGKNQWGHPEKQILDLLSRYNVPVFRTDQKGDVVVVTDGKTWNIL